MIINKLKIKYKLLLINVVSTIVVVVFTGGFWIHASLTSYQKTFREQIVSQGKLVGNNSTAAIIFEDWEEAKVILSTLSSEKSITSAKLVYQNSVPVEVIFSPRNGHNNDLMSWFHFNGSHDQKVSVPVANLNDTLAAIEIDFHNFSEHDFIFESLLLIFKAASLALIIGTVFSMRMQSYVTRPIQNLSSVAKEVTDSKVYSLRAKFFYSDEVGSLTNNFNSMLEIIQQREMFLEQTVRERTQELVDKNEQLMLQVEMREKSEQAQRESEEKFQKAFINAPVGMAIVNKDGMISQYNNALQSVVGDIKVKSFSLRRLVHESSLAKVDSYFLSLVIGEIDRFQEDIEYFNSVQEKLFGTISVSSVTDKNGLFLYAVFQLQDVTESKLLADKLEHQAKHDALTGLANRRVLRQTLQDVISWKENRTHTFCMLDLDQFKVVNDTCGHAAGDELLRQIASLLTERVNSKDLVVRLGGDEFAIVLYDSNQIQARKTTEKIRSAIEKWEFGWKGKILRIGVSIGAVTIDKFTLSISKVMQEADAACFVAKDMGRNCVYFTEGARDEQILSRHGEMQWVQRIHEAMEQDNFVLYSQTIVSLKTNNSEIRHEILLRLDENNGQGLIPPGAFIPAAERYGISEKLDGWVVTKLIKTLKENRSLTTPGSCYWVNLSGASLSTPSFLDFLENKVRDSGLPRGLINFEITETAAMENIHFANTGMKRLQKIGCQFALDDFGSGFSSFGYLKNLSVDYLKIDGLFVRGIISDEVNLIFVKSIIDIAKSMGLKTIAEYVESEEIKSKLIEIGADYAQGYFMGKPKPLLEK